MPGDPFPQRGSLETLASGRALDRLADYAAIQYRDSFLGKMAAQKGDIDGHDVVAGAEAGDEASLWCLRVLGERIGIGIANAINTFDPLEVVIGGGVSRAGELLLEPARDAAFRHVVPGLGLNTTIRIARHGPRAGVLGAALIAAQEYAEDTGQNLQGAISGEADREDRVRVRPCGVPAQGDGGRDRGGGGPRGRWTSAPGRRTRSTTRTRPGSRPRPCAATPTAPCWSAAPARASRSRPASSRTSAPSSPTTPTPPTSRVEHDDCNILCLGGRVIGPALAADIIRAYLAAAFTGEDRHKRRLAKIDGIEREFLRDDIF